MECRRLIVIKRSCFFAGQSFVLLSFFPLLHHFYPFVFLLFTLDTSVLIWSDLPSQRKHSRLFPYSHVHCGSLLYQESLLRYCGHFLDTGFFTHSLCKFAEVDAAGVVGCIFHYCENGSVHSDCQNPSFHWRSEANFMAEL